jgi:hypothetical protein
MENVEISNFNRFDPLTGDPSILPNQSGIYVICSRNLDCLPKAMESVEMKYFDDMPIIYVGISTKSIRKRDYKNHFTGSARNSTLRKSLGVLLGLEKFYFSDGKYKFVDSDEMKLSCWARTNLIMLYVENENPGIHEKELIKKYNPPLNLAINDNIINKDFREYLSVLRNNHN